MAKRTTSDQHDESVNRHNLFYRELETSLESSTGAQLKKWATHIINENIPVISLLQLLLAEEKTAMRFRWLISDIGLQDRGKLYDELPALFRFMEQNCPADLSAFASWWHYAGVPPEQEAKAIDYLFRWFLSAETNISIKTRALWVLVELSRKYPELKQELKLCLADQMDKYSKDFRKRAEKILGQL